MKKIIIEIPDDLSKKDEALLIAKKISKKMGQIANSGTSKKEQKLIGNQQFDDFKLPNSIIEIKRVSKHSNLSAMITCGCGTLFNKKEGAAYWTNYGGKIRKIYCCGDDCRDLVLNAVGIGRAAVNKKSLQPFRFF